MVRQMKIKEVIVVEGKNDTNVLKSYFDCDTIETQGTHLSEMTLKLIEETNKTRGIIIFTDPDSPGEKIRMTINQRINGCKNAFVPKEKSRTSKKVGIEHADKETLETALSQVVTFDKNIQSDLTMNDFFELGLTGTPESKNMRKKLTTKLGIGESNAKTLLNRCKMLELKRQDLETLLKR